MNAIVHTKSGRPNYYIVLDFKDDNGKRQRKWVSTDIPVKGNHKREAEEKRKEVLAEYEKKANEREQQKQGNEQNANLGRDILFIVFMENWLESLKFSLAPTTYEAYSLILKTHIKPHFELQRIKVVDLMPAHIQQYVKLKMETLSPNTIIKHLRNISKCLDSAVKQGLIMFNPVKGIEMPKRVKYTGAKHYNEKQIEQLLEASKGDPLEIVILLTIFYGFRRSEVLGLKYDAIDFDNNTIEINHTVTQFNSGVVYKLDATKNDSSSTVIPLPNIIKARLRKWRAQQLQYKLLLANSYNDEGYVCTLPDGSLIRPNYVSHHFSILLKNNGLPPIRFHDLRHSSATYLKYLGFDLKDIQTWLRHKDIQTTMNIYTHLDMDAKINIAECLNEKFKNFC